MTPSTSRAVWATTLYIQRPLVPYLYVVNSWYVCMIQCDSYVVNDIVMILCFLILSRDRDEINSLSSSYFARYSSFHLLLFQAPGLAGQVLTDIAVGLFTQNSIVSLPGAWRRRLEQYCRCVPYRQPSPLTLPLHCCCSGWLHALSAPSAPSWRQWRGELSACRSSQSRCRWSTSRAAGGAATPHLCSSSSWPAPLIPNTNTSADLPRDHQTHH